MLAFYQNLDSDPLDTVKIATVRHLGLLKSANKVEKVRIMEALENVHSHYRLKADTICMVM